jgi:hypothetical protein
VTIGVAKLAVSGDPTVARFVVKVGFRMRISARRIQEKYKKLSLWLFLRTFSVGPRYDTYLGGCDHRGLAGVT